MQTVERSPIFPISPDEDQQPTLEEMEQEIEALAHLLRNRFYAARRIQDDINAAYDPNYFVVSRSRRARHVTNLYFAAMKAVEL